MRSLSSPMSSMARRTSSLRGSDCLSSFSCWHSAISCNMERGKLSKPQLTTSTRHGTLIDKAVLRPTAVDSLGLIQSLSKTALAISYGLIEHSCFLSSRGMWNDHNGVQQYVTKALDMITLRRERHSGGSELQNWEHAALEVKSKL